jgi:hypothetical protein
MLFICFIIQFSFFQLFEQDLFFFSTNKLKIEFGNGLESRRRRRRLFTCNKFILKKLTRNTEVFMKQKKTKI